MGINHFRYKDKRGFTLIELLVVVAIIGILSAVVVVSISAAREKSKISFIKSSLKSLYNEAEIFYTQNNTYAGLYSATTYDCTGALSRVAESMTTQGVTVKCYSRNDSSRTDVHLRFGATAIIYDTDSFKAWSVDQNGIVEWEQQGVNASGQQVNPDTYIGMTYQVSLDACAISGARLPSLEQTFTLARAYYAASGNISYKPTDSGFDANLYWTSSVVPSLPTSQAYVVNFSNSNIFAVATNAQYRVRCVK